MAENRTERQLILLSATVASRRQALGERAEQLCEDVNWARLEDMLRLRRLLTRLGPRAIELADGRATKDFCASVDQAITAARHHSVFLQLVALRAIAMLADAGIRAAPLKGPLLGEAIYGDPGRRPSGDIDLLVAPRELNAAVGVIRKMSYAAPTDYVYNDGLPLLHLTLMHDRCELPPVEIHWRVHWYDRDFACERLLPPVADPLGQWRPAPTDELAALLLFYARDGFVDLRLAADLGAWWDVHGSDLPRGAMAELLDAYPGLGRVIPAATMAAGQVVGLPSSDIIGNTPSIGIRGRVAVRLANPHPQSNSRQLYAEIGLIDGLLAPRGGLGSFVRRNVLPPPAVLMQQARHAERPRPRTPLARGMGVLARYGLAMTRLLRPNETLR
jgi:hypothetical protein